MLFFQPYRGRCGTDITFGCSSETLQIFSWFVSLSSLPWYGSGGGGWVVASRDTTHILASDSLILIVLSSDWRGGRKFVSTCSTFCVCVRTYRCTSPGLLLLFVGPTPTPC